ncbi:homeobox-like protein HDP1 [Argiope bruennichi]|uniref:homeobox-like protein HDP1 n=1 Tax=Argiope bruennichi TaxID=94029 RepID=UPI00249595A1|nr:homeobox-like protein HDP1 [Argiope bruennichi]
MHLNIMLLLGIVLVLIVQVTESNEILKLPLALIQNGMNGEFIQGKIFPFFADMKESIEQFKDSNAVSKLINRILQDGKDDMKFRLKRDVSNILTKNCSENRTNVLKNDKFQGVKLESSNLNENSQKSTVRRFKRNIEYDSSDVLLRDSSVKQEENTESVRQDLESINMEDENMRSFRSQIESLLENDAHERQFFESEDRRILEPVNKRIFKSENRRFFETGGRKVFEPEGTVMFLTGNKEYREVDDGRNFEVDDGSFEIDDGRKFTLEDGRNIEAYYKRKFKPDNPQNFEADDGLIFESEDARIFKPKSSGIFESENIYNKKSREPFENSRDNTPYVHQNLESMFAKGRKMKDFGSKFQRNTESYSNDRRFFQTNETNNNDTEYMNGNSDLIFGKIQNRKSFEPKLKRNLEIDVASQRNFSQHLLRKYPNYKWENKAINEDMASTFVIPKARNIFTRKKRNVLTHINPLHINSYKELVQNTVLSSKNYLDLKKLNDTLINNIRILPNNSNADSEKMFSFVQNLNSANEKLQDLKNRNLAKNSLSSYLNNEHKVPKNYIFQKNTVKESTQTPEKEFFKKISSPAFKEIKKKSLQQVHLGDKEEFSVSIKNDDRLNLFEGQGHNLLKGKNHLRNKWHNGNALEVGDVKANQKKDNITRTFQINSDENVDKQISNATRELLISKKNGEKGTMVSLIRNKKGYALEDVGNYSKQNKGILNAEAIKENSMRNDRRNEDEEADKSPIDVGKTGFIFRSFDNRDGIRHKFPNKRNKFPNRRPGVGKNTNSKSKQKKNNQKKATESKLKQASVNLKKYIPKKEGQKEKNKLRQSGNLSKSNNKKKNDLNKNSIKQLPAIGNPKALYQRSFKKMKSKTDPKLKGKKQLNLKEIERKKKYETLNSGVSSEMRFLGLKGDTKLNKAINKIQQKAPKIELKLNYDGARNNQIRFKIPPMQKSFDSNDVDFISNLFGDKKESLQLQKNENMMEKIMRGIHFKNAGFPFNKGKNSIDNSQKVDDRKSKDKKDNIQGFAAFNFKKSNLLNRDQVIPKKVTAQEDESFDRNNILSGIGSLFNNINANTRNIISGIVNKIKSGIKGETQNLNPRIPKNRLIESVKDNFFMNEIPIKLKVKIITENEHNVKDEALAEKNKKRTNYSNSIPEFQIRPLINGEGNAQNKSRAMDSKNVISSDARSKIDALFSHKSNSSKLSNNKINWNIFNKDREDYGFRLTDIDVLESSEESQVRDIVKLDKNQSKNKKDSKCQSGVKYYIVLQETDSGKILNNDEVLDHNKPPVMHKNNPAALIPPKFYTQNYSPDDKFHREKENANHQPDAFPRHNNEMNDNIAIKHNIKGNRIQSENDIEENLGGNEIRKFDYFEPEFSEAKRVEMKKIRANANRSNIELQKEQTPISKLNNISNSSSEDNQNGSRFNQRNPFVSKKNNDKIFNHPLFQRIFTKESTDINYKNGSEPKYKFPDRLQNTNNSNEVLRNSTNHKGIFGKVKKGTSNIEVKKADMMKIQPSSEKGFTLDSRETNIKEIFHPEQWASYITHPKNKMKNIINQKILFQNNSKTPLDINIFNAPKEIPGARNIKLTKTDVFVNIPPEKLTYDNISNENLGTIPKAQQSTFVFKALLKPNQNIPSDNRINRDDISEKPNRKFFNKLKNACGKLSRKGKNDITDSKNQAHIFQKNDASRYYKGIKDETGINVNSIENSNLNANDDFTLEMETITARNSNSIKNAFDWSEIREITPKFDSFLNNFILEDGKKSKILSPKKTVEMNLESSSNEIGNKEMHDQKKSDEASKIKPSFGINDISQLLLGIHNTKMAIKNSGNVVDSDSIQNIFPDNLNYEKPAEVFISGNLRKVIQNAESVPERKDKNNLAKFEYLMNNSLPKNDILMNILQLSMKNADENHNGAWSSLNTEENFMNQKGKKFGENFNQDIAMKNYDNLLPENPMEDYLNPNDLKMVKNSTIFSNNQGAVVPINSNLEIKFKNLLQPNDIIKHNDFFNQNAESNKYPRKDVMSSQNSASLEDISEYDDGKEILDQNDSSSSDLFGNFEPNAIEGLMSLPDKLPEKPLIEFQLNVSPCCKYASKVLGIFSGKRNKSFSDFTQRCFCAYCPRYFNRFAKNPFNEHSSDEDNADSKIEELPPSVYWTRALWLTLQCMKI